MLLTEIICCHVGFSTNTEPAMSSEQLERIKAKRAGHRGIVTQLIKETVPLFLERVREGA